MRNKDGIGNVGQDPESIPLPVNGLHNVYVLFVHTCRGFVAHHVGTTGSRHITREILALALQQRENHKR